LSMSRIARLMARFHTMPRPALPAWATEDTTEVQALVRVSAGIEWASESTGLLETVRSGLVSLDDEDEAGGCREGQPRVWPGHVTSG
jgi:hypothetical protein